LPRIVRAAGMGIAVSEYVLFIPAVNNAPLRTLQNNVFTVFHHRDRRLEGDF
jgi:hypothetical protein